MNQSKTSSCVMDILTPTLLPWWYAPQHEMRLESTQMTDNNTALSNQVGGNHYKEYAIQPVEFIAKNNIPYIEGCIIKYALRHKEKNGVQDLRKIKHYVELLAELEYGEKL